MTSKITPLVAEPVRNFLNNPKLPMPEDYEVPAKYTIEMDCANNTCQSEMEKEDHSPAVPLLKTGVVEVISKNDKYKFD